MQFGGMRGGVCAKLPPSIVFSRLIVSPLFGPAEVVSLTSHSVYHQQNMPWSQTYRLPGPSPTQSIIILAADPSVFAVFSQEQAAELKRSHPHIKTRLVKGAGHDIYIEIGHRDVIVEAALEAASV
jgi:hypothetical protein